MVQQKKDVITLVGVGDIRPERDDPPSIFRYCGDVLRSADIAFGQQECQFSDRGSPIFSPYGYGGVIHTPKNVSSLTEKGGGFDVMSFATNAAMFYGHEAFFDTIDLLTKNGIAVVGAGKNIAAARKPAILERKGTKIGFLAYLSAVFPGLVAEENMPGCAPLRATHRYQQVDFQPGTPPLIVTKLFPEDKEAMEADIKKLRSKVDVLVVSMHCGVHFVPAVIAMYQREAAYAAIDAGADLILQHHAHILKGIEIYKGKAIFYGLGVFADEPGSNPPSHPRGGSAMYRLLDRPTSLPEFYRIKSIPGYERYHYHPDALKTMIAKAYIQDKKIQKVTYIPAYITPNAEPEVVKKGNPRAQEVFDYVVQISEAEDLKARFSWEGDEVLVRGIK